ncbi:uncharacterized protein LOC116266798 [Nymphaea colorata]|nr:uncharacterized protein LOC116266798 [Nymphaea colorata]
MEVPECPVCLLVYNGEEAVPRVLSCGHTICEPCLQQLPPYLPNSIKCPECNQVAKFPAQGPSGLPKNIDLLRLIPHSTSQKTAQRAPPSSSIKNSSDGSLFGLPTDRSCRSWKDLTVPSDVIQVLDEKGDSDISLGVASSSWSCLRKNQNVGLLPLLIGDGGSSGSVIRLTYGLRILKILDGLSRFEKDELTFLLKASAMGRRVCKLYGLWMNSDGRVFLVFERFRLENRSILDGLRGGCLVKPIGCSPDSRDVMVRFSSLALEICEAVMVLHSQGIVLGFLSPVCFGFDEYGHVLIDLSNSLLEKKRIQEAFLGSMVDRSEEDEFDDLVSKQIFISPEAFKRLYSENLGAGSSTTNLNHSDAKFELEASFSCKSDVWSLACMLIKLILEDPFVDEFLSGYYGYCFAESRESIGVGVGDYMSCIKRKVADMAPIFGAKFEELHNVLSKCLDLDVDTRPQMSDVWKGLKAITYGCGSDELQVQFQHEKVEWCLVLAHLYSVHRCSNSSQQRDKGSMLDKVDQVALVDGSGLNSESCSNVNIGHTSEGCRRVTVTQTFDDKVVEQIPNDGGKTITLRGHLDCITGLAIGGGYLLSSSFDKTVRMWSLQEFCHVRTVNYHAHRVTAIVVLDMDEPLCITADSGGGIYVWALDPQLEQEPLKTWREHSDWRYSGVHSLAVSGLDVLYSGSGDKSIKAWSLKDYSLMCAMTGHKSVVSSLSVNNGILYSGSWDGTVRLWWISDHSPLMVLEDDPPIAISSVLSLSVNQDIAVAGHENGLLKIWSNGELVKSTKIDDGPILSIDMNGKWLFAATWKKTISIQELYKDESELDAKPAGCIDCDSVATSLLYYGGNLFVGFSNKDIKVYACG